MSKKLFYFAQKGIILNKEKDSILVNKYTDSKYLPEKLTGRMCLPGGRVYEDEPDLGTSFVKTIEKETGVKMIPKLPFYVWDWSYEIDSKVQNIVAIGRVGIYESGDIRTSPVEKPETMQATPFWLRLEDLEIEQFVEDEQEVIRKYLEYIKNNPFENL